MARIEVLCFSTKPNPELNLMPQTVTIFANNSEPATHHVEFPGLVSDGYTQTTMRVTISEARRLAQFILDHTEAGKT